ncbi:MAG: hypothetical protein NZ730_13645 [Porticoccaceae bacterium]|nr:hypothetical protein [Porticoccaceae bacterium]
MNFPGVSPTQQYLIDNAVMYGGYTPEEAYAEIVGTTNLADPTAPTDVYMNPEVVVNGGDTRQPDIGVEGIISGPVDVDTEVAVEEEAPWNAAGGAVDRIAQVLMPAYGFLREIKGAVEPEYAPGTWARDAGEWLGLLDPYQPNVMGSDVGIPDGLDSGSFTSVNGGSNNGGYSYGTIDGIGVETPN